MKCGIIRMCQLPLRTERNLLTWWMVEFYVTSALKRGSRHGRGNNEQRGWHSNTVIPSTVNATTNNIFQWETVLKHLKCNPDRACRTQELKPLVKCHTNHWKENKTRHEYHPSASHRIWRGIKTTVDMSWSVFPNMHGYSNQQFSLQLNAISNQFSISLL